MWQQKLKFFEIILKVHPGKQENAFENMNDTSFVTWAVPRRLKIKLNIRIMCLKIEVFSNISKQNWKIKR